MRGQILNQCLNPYVLLILSVASVTLSVIDSRVLVEEFVVVLFSIIMVLIAIRSARVHHMTFSKKIFAGILALVLVSLIWDGLFFWEVLPQDLRNVFFIGAALIRLTIFSYGWLLFAKTLATRQRVTDRTIVTAIVGYLFIGIIWSFIYLVIWQVDPKALHISIIRDYDFKPWNLVMYFSFMTLTTVGYGDIIPINQWVMVLSNFEAMTGAFYLTVVISRLVEC
jgi:hypothetical protein